MIVHDNDLICIPYLGKAHFFHFILKESSINIMDDYAVRLYNHQITWFYAFTANMFHNDFFS